MKSPEMQPPVSEHPEVGQNPLIITIGDRNIVVPRKELYGIPDIGNAIGSGNPVYIRNKLWRARKSNPDINPQYLGIGQRHSTLLLSEKDFVLAVTTIIPTIKGKEGSYQKGSVTLPDGQTITLRGKKQIRTLRLLIDAFKEDQPYVSTEELVGFDTSQGIPLSLGQRKTFSQVLRRLRSNTLTVTGWDIQSITVNGKRVETRPKGYTLKEDKAQKPDAPTLILQSIFGNDAVVRELATDRPGKTSILENTKQQINSLDPREKVLFLEKTFAILSDPDPEHQNKRDAALELLKIMDLKSIDPKELTKTYIEAVSALREDLNHDSDPYGEIHMLLQAGKIIAPFIKNAGSIMRAWNLVAEAFAGSDRQKILADKEEIRQLIPTTYSQFDTEVLMLVRKGLRSQKIAQELGVTMKAIQQSKCRLNDKGVRFKDFKKSTSNSYPLLNR